MFFEQSSLEIIEFNQHFEMEGQSSDAEVIKVIIVDDDGNETEVDANCIKLEISNTEDFESLEGI